MNDGHAGQYTPHGFSDCMTATTCDEDTQCDGPVCILSSVITMPEQCAVRYMGRLKESTSRLYFFLGFLAVLVHGHLSKA